MAVATRAYQCSQRFGRAITRGKFTGALSRDFRLPTSTQLLFRFLGLAWRIREGAPLLRCFPRQLLQQQQPLRRRR